MTPARRHLAVVAACLALAGGAAIPVSHAVSALSAPAPTSPLIGQMDYSDTFTEGLNGRVANQAFPPGSEGTAALNLENTYASPPKGWGDDRWAFAKDSNASTGSNAYPGGDGVDSGTGMVQMSYTQGSAPATWEDWGIQYGVRTDFVAEVRFVQTYAGVDIVQGAGKDSINDLQGVAVIFRAPNSGGPQVGVYSQAVGKEYDTGFASGVTINTWHDYAVEYNLDRRGLAIYVDQQLAGTVDLTSFAGGAFAGIALSNNAVSVGANLGTPDVTGTNPITWADDFMVGAPAGAAIPSPSPSASPSPIPTDQPYDRPFVLFKGTAPSELGPGAPPSGGDGNTYGPEVHFEDGVYKMWYGGQGTDGRERIHYATSADGVNWDRHGVVIDDPNDPLIEDASVVNVDGVYHMYFTAAAQGTIDTIHAATSTDGIHWTLLGMVFNHGPAGSWDDFDVGRPSVVLENGVWKMWFDGCQGTYLGTGLEQCSGFRSVGYATSADGIHWAEYAGNPVFAVNESVHVSKYRGYYVMLGENQQGTRLALSKDGIHWLDDGFLIHLSGQPYDQYGQVTPDLLYGSDGRPAMVYFGLARNSCWCQNLMGAARLRGDELDRWIATPGTGGLGAPDYSDTFTAGSSGRTANGSFPVGATQGASALQVENSYGHATQSWPDAHWSFDDDSDAGAGYPGGSSRGSAGGMVQFGYLSGSSPGQPNDWGIPYAVRNDFVVQADFVQPAGYVALTTGGTASSEADAHGLTVRFRAPGTSGPEVGLYNSGLGEIDTGVRPSLRPGAWHTYAVRFDLLDQRLLLFADFAPIGAVDLSTFDDGAFLALIPSGAAVTVGAQLGDAGVALPTGWADNFFVGAPAMPTSLSVTAPAFSAAGGTLPVSGRLLNSYGGAVAGEAIQFGVGGGSGQHCTGLTDAQGQASCSITGLSVALGPEAVTATFSGGGGFSGSSASATTTVFAFPATGGFVVGDASALAGSSAQFWGSGWTKSNRLSGGPAPGGFFGYATTVPERCGSGGWTVPATAVRPAPASVPSYLAVVSSSSVSTDGTSYSGPVTGITILKVTGFSAQGIGTGTVLGYLC